MDSSTACFILDIINYVLSYFFGCYFSALQVTDHKHKHENLYMSIIDVVTFSIAITVGLRYGSNVTLMLTPLITHLPLTIFYMTYYKKHFVEACAAVSTAYMCCLLPQVVQPVVLLITGVPEYAKAVRAIAALIIFLSLIKHFSVPVKYMTSQNIQITTAYSLTPICFYIFHYATCVFTNALYEGNEIIADLLMTLLTATFLCFILFYIKEYEQRIEAEKNKQLLALQLSNYESIKKRIEETRKARHDLRQHLRLIQTYLDTDNKAALQDYIDKYGVTIPKYSRKHYCDNTAINGIIQFYAEQAIEHGVNFTVDAPVSDDINVEEPDLCVLLGNLLENAMDSCMDHLDDAPFISINIKPAGATTLVITVDNAPADSPRKKNGAIVSTKAYGSGIGTNSVREISKRYNGETRYEWKDGVFFASVILNPGPRPVENKDTVQ